MDQEREQWPLIKSNPGGSNRGDGGSSWDGGDGARVMEGEDGG